MKCTAGVEDNHADNLEMTIVVDPLLLLLLPCALRLGSPHNLHLHRGKPIRDSPPGLLNFVRASNSSSDLCNLCINQAIAYIKHCSRSNNYKGPSMMEEPPQKRFRVS